MSQSDLESPLKEYYESNSTETLIYKVDKYLRKDFVRKVYGIICAQLSLTIILSFFSLYFESFRKFQLQNPTILLVSLILVLIIIILLTCFTKFSRKAPLNYIICFIFTLCESYSVSSLCGYINHPKMVIIACFLTLFITSSLTIYSFITKDDFTLCGSSLFIISSALLGFTVMLFIFGTIYVEFLLISLVIIIIYGFYIVFDTQLIIGGKTYELSIDDYMIGSVIIYTDVIGIFIRLLIITTFEKK